MLRQPLHRRIRALPPPSDPEPCAADLVSPDDMPTPIELPRDTIPITQLPDTHPAIAYLRDRGFDPSELQDSWQVGYSDYCAVSRPPIAGGRIIIPVWRPAMQFAPDTASQPRVLTGWQARAVPEIQPVPGAPKYLSAAGFRKSESLYGLPQALQSIGPIFLCEGVFDAWRLGPGALALFGKTLSNQQKALLGCHFSAREVVVMLDADAAEDARRIRDQLQRVRGPGSPQVVIAMMPSGRTDPGECTQEELVQCLLAALDGHQQQEV
jgi:hypothetical protein